MDISILTGPKPCVFECMRTIEMHLYALHKERDDFDPPNDITAAVDRVHNYLLGNG